MCGNFIKYKYHIFRCMFRHQIDNNTFITNKYIAFHTFVTLK